MRLWLDGEDACVLENVILGTPTIYFSSVRWPRHAVAVEVSTSDRNLGLAIIRTAHAVSVDRNGCAARREVILPSTRPGLPNRQLLPATARTLSVCWYLHNRLGASALLATSSAGLVVAAVNSSPPKWPAPMSRPALVSCESVSRRDGVLLAAHTPRQPDVVAVGNFAACNGQQTVFNGAAAVLATDYLADTIATVSGIRLWLNYPTSH